MYKRQDKNCIKGLHNRWAKDIKDAVDTEQYRGMNSSERMDAQKSELHAFYLNLLFDMIGMIVMCIKHESIANLVY